MNNCNEKESKEFPGFYEIVGFDTYVVSKDGKVLNKKTKKLLKGCLKPNGYFNYGLTDDTRIKRTVARHRTMMFAFKTFEKGSVVNHKNGIKGDDWLDNLEWTTHQGNLEHAGAMGLSKSCLPIDVRDVDTGEVIRYPSYTNCGAYLGFTKDAINYRVKCGETRVFPERKQYRSAFVTTPWFIPDKHAIAHLRHGRSRSVLLKNVETDETFAFEKAMDVAEYLKVCIASVSGWLSDESQPLIKDIYLIKWMDSIAPWRQTGSFFQECLSNRAKRVVCVTNDTTKQVTTFTSAVECARVMGLNPTALNYRLTSNGEKVFKDGNRYSYYS